MKNKTNSIDMTRKIREKQYEEIKFKSHSEIIEYFKNRSQDILKNKKQILANK